MTQPEKAENQKKKTEKGGSEAEYLYAKQTPKPSPGFSLSKTMFSDCSRTFLCTRVPKSSKSPPCAFLVFSNRARPKSRRN